MSAEQNISNLWSVIFGDVCSIYLFIIINILLHVLKICHVKDALIRRAFNMCDVKTVVLYYFDIFDPSVQVYGKMLTCWMSAMSLTLYFDVFDVSTGTSCSHQK